MNAPTVEDVTGFNKVMQAMLPELHLKPEFPEEEAIGEMLLEMSNRLGAFAEAHRQEIFDAEDVA